MKRRKAPPPSHLRLVTPADAPDDDAASEGLPVGWGAQIINKLMATMWQTANEVTDRAVGAMRSEVVGIGLDFNESTLSAIRNAVFDTVAAGIYARMHRGFRGSDYQPDENDQTGNPDHDAQLYIEHFGVGLRERLRAVLDPDDEPA